MFVNLFNDSISFIRGIAIFGKQGKRKQKKNTGAKFTTELAEKVYKIFRSFDADGNGLLSLQELLQLLQSLDKNVKAQEVTALGKRLNISTRGLMSFSDCKLCFV
jgi:Ca2+-binding EF-hand superfamily protein